MCGSSVTPAIEKIFFSGAYGDVLLSNPVFLGTRLPPEQFLNPLPDGRLLDAKPLELDP